MTDYNVGTLDGSTPFRSTTDTNGKNWIHTFAAAVRRTPIAPSEKLTVGTGAVVSLSPPGTATHCLIYNETNDIRFYEDGSTPTTGPTGNGPVLPAGNWWELDSTAMSSFKMIAKATTSTVHVIYHRYV